MFTKNKLWVLRLGTYTIGLFLLALGVAFAVKSDLGVSPVNVLPYTISRLTGLEQGLLTTFCFCMFILLQIVILKKEFHPIQLFQIACAVLFGYFVSCTNALLQGFTLHAYWQQALFSLFSILLIAFGMFLYLCADLIPQPMEGFCLAVEKKYHMPYARVKMVCDCSLVALSCIVSFLSTGHVFGVREGSVLTMLTVGPLIGVFQRLWQARLQTVLKS